MAEPCRKPHQLTLLCPIPRRLTTTVSASNNVYSRDARVIRHFADRSEDEILRDAVFHLTDATRAEADGMSKTQCRKMLENVFINIYDYVGGAYDRVCALRAR